MSSNKQLMSERSAQMYIVFLIIFCIGTIVVGQYALAAGEALVILALIIYTIVSSRRKRKELVEYIESITYDTETAKNNTFQSFPLPLAVFRMTDTTIIWGNQMFFDVTGLTGAKTGQKISALAPEFSGKWLLEGKNQYPNLIEINDRKYQVSGNLIRSEKDGQVSNMMGISYWLDVTDYDNIRLEYEKTRPVVALLVVDNYEELMKNQADRVVSSLRDDLDDMIVGWSEEFNGLIKRITRERYLMVFEEQYIKKIIAEKFSILEKVHSITNASGIHATLSIGIGLDGAGYAENHQFANMGIEMALSRGGDQAVLKNRFNFDFFGGRRGGVETRTKVKSRVMANALSELIGDASKVYVMGHKAADYDAVGAAAAVCCIARKQEKPFYIISNIPESPAVTVIEKLKKEPSYKNAFIDAEDAIVHADSKTLLVLVDTNRPEQAEDSRLLEACHHVAVIDHHRRAATYVQKPDLSYIEPYASSACELMTEILQVVTEPSDLLTTEAEAMLSGIVLDTKNFNLRTGERTFDAAAFLRRAGADPTEVKILMQTDLPHTVKKYRILQSAHMYRDVAIAAPKVPQERVVAAQAADELLNVSGVSAAVVAYPNEAGVYVSARSIGDLNVQLIMESLGGGGNRNAAACQMEGVSIEQALDKIHQAIDEYLAS